MPQVTVYIRKEDLSKWESLKKKSEFMHNALGTVRDLAILGEYKLNEYAKENDLPKLEIVEKVYKRKLPISTERLTNGLCKIHDTPLDDRGRCMVKGCKYG